MGVVPRRRVVLNMCGGDGDTTFPLFGRLIDCAIFEEAGQSLLGLSFRNGSGQGGLINKH